MAQFTPNANFKPEKKEFVDIPSGFYVLRPKFHEVKTSNTGNRYRKVRFQVEGGEYAGNSVFLSCSFQTQHDIVASLWNCLAGAAAVTDSFDPEGDEDWESNFHRVPMALEVKAIKRGEYTNHEIVGFIAPSDTGAMEAAGIREAFDAAFDDDGSGGGGSDTPF